MEPVRTNPHDNLATNAGNAQRASVGFVSFRVERRLSASEYSVRSGGKTFTAVSSVPLEPGLVARGKFFTRENRVYIELEPVRPPPRDFTAAFGLTEDTLSRSIVRTFQNLGLQLDRNEMARARRIAEKSDSMEDAVLVYATARANGIELPEEAVLGIASSADRRGFSSGNGDGDYQEAETGQLAASVALALKALAGRRDAEPGLVSVFNGISSGTRKILLVPLGLSIGTVDFRGFLLLYYNEVDAVFRVDSSMTTQDRLHGIPERWFCSVSGKSVTVRPSCDLSPGDRDTLATRLGACGFSLTPREPEDYCADLHA